MFTSSFLEALNAGVTVAAVTDIKSGLGFGLYFIWGLALLVAAVLGVHGGFSFKDDPAKAKLEIAGAVLIPVILGIIQYIFKSVLKIDISATDSLTYMIPCVNDFCVSCSADAWNILSPLLNPMIQVMC